MTGGLALAGAICLLCALVAYWYSNKVVKKPHGPDAIGSAIGFVMLFGATFGLGIIGLVFLAAAGVLAVFGGA